MHKSKVTTEKQISNPLPQQNMHKKKNNQTANPIIT